jgi:sugar transferase (PEP-CTERM/EpsH1 system associated)
MSVLQFAPKVVWPLDTGAKLRNFHLARVLAQRAHVTLLAFSDPDYYLVTRDPYQHVTAVVRDNAYTFSKVVRGGLGPTPLPVLNYTTKRMKEALAHMLSGSDFDLIQVESIHLMAYLPIIRASPKKPLAICDWHNIESELMQRYSERDGSSLRKVYAGRTARLMIEFERRAAREFDAHVVVSERDAARLRALNPAARIFVIENGVDTAFYSDEDLDHAGGLPGATPLRNRIVFVGSMDYHANIDGAVNFGREVWPCVRAQHPDLIYTIVGRDPAAEVRALAKMPGVEVTGTVADVRPFYRAALAAVAPLNIGGGSRLKILEAMAAGIPVVSTTLGAEGLAVQPGENILIADTNEQLAETINSLLKNESQRRHLKRGGRALISERYDWSRLGESLLDAYDKLLATRN